MPEMTRRSVLLAGAGAAVAATAPKRARADSVRGWDVAVVGAGVFGAWIAKRLQDAGITFRNEMETGPGGKQIQIEDPDGNPIELFEPAR